MTATSAPRKSYLGLVVYHWGRRHQNRLLVECLGPTAAEIRQQGLADCFWFDRYDARGPHIFTVLILNEAHYEAAATRLSESLGHFLALHPSTESLGPGQLEKLHQETRGRLQCAADGWEGFAVNNTYVSFEHPLQGYPFPLSKGSPGEEEIWNLVDFFTFWSIAQLAARDGEPAVEAGIRWIAGIDHELRVSGEDPAAYWRYHAQTLIPPLSERLATEEEEVLRSLPASVGERNAAVFSRIWATVEATGPWDSQARLVHLAASRAGRPETRRWALLREIDHWTLKQLGLPVALHIPIVLFAWSRSLATAPGAALTELRP